MNTRGSALLLGAAALALLAHVSTALGAGKVTGIILNPPDVKTCAIETITVNGTGKCTSLTVFFGDGSRLITLGKPRPFPQTFHHVYSKGGFTELSVETYTGPGSTCTGKASRTMQVVAGPKPTITSMFTLGFFFSYATPGALVILQGENFGNLPGQAWIHLKKLDDTPADYQLVLAHPNDWGDTFVAGTIPSIPGVLDQQATFTVVAQCGGTSNTVSGSFVAARDVVDLAYVGDPPAGGNHWYPWFQCAMSAAPGGNQCENSGADDWPNECGVAAFSEAGFGNLDAYHAVAWSPNGHPGHDDFWINDALLNGWVLLSTSADWTTQVNSGGQVSVDSGWTSAPGTSNPHLQVNWYVNSCSAIFYSGHMFITGPLGVPY
jgi:hypothetical protein